MRHRLATTVVVALVAFGCSSSTQNHGFSNGVTRGKTNAVIAIHTAPAAAVDLETVRICARNGMAGKVAVPSTITWVADDPAAKLDIVWSDPAQVCVRGKHCNGAVCTAISNVEFRGSTPARCEYTVVLNGTSTKDPGIEVENCCP